MKVITNSLGNCDWVVVTTDAGMLLFEGHRVGPQDLVDIINNCGGVGPYKEDARLVEVDDEQMEEGDY